MKKLVVSIITALFLGCASAAIAQIEQQNVKTNPVQAGNIVVKLFDVFGYAGFESGDLYSSLDPELIGINEGFLHPYDSYLPTGSEVNYFIIDGLALGGSFHYVKQKSPGGGSNEMIMKSLGPSMYYYYNLNGMILPYVTISYLYSKVDLENTMAITLIRIPLGAGVTVMAGKYVGVYGQVDYNFDKIKTSGNDPETGRMFDFKVGVKAFF